MENELEEEIVVLSQLKTMSRFVINFPLNWTSFAVFFRNLLRPETLIVTLAVVAVVLVLQSCEVWNINFLNKFHLAAQLNAAGKGRFHLFVNPAQGGDAASWEVDGDDAAVFAIQGRRAKMEDRYQLVSDPENGISLYGIFDGHGGESAAEFVEKNLFKALIKKLQTAKDHNHLNRRPSVKVTPKTEDGKQENANGLTFPSLTSEFSRLLTEEILIIDEQLLNKAKASRDVAGTTALVAVVYNNQLIVANVGDSRGVICDSKGTAIPLSFDHKPQQLKEHRRIKEAGGFITFNGVWRVAGILATSRALGDFPLKDRKLIIAEPDILTFNLDDLKPKFMILATDGLWDTFTNEEAVAFINENLNETHLGAKSLVYQAYRRGSVDNITVMVVDFRGYQSKNLEKREE